MNAVKNISGRQFSIFRIVFGSYLAIHFFLLVPYAGELFSGEGVLPDSSVNFTHGFFPNVLEWFPSAAFATGFVVFMGICAIAFAAGYWRRTAAVLLWFGWATLFTRNNLISNPSLPYVGLLLVLSALVPPHENRPDWQMPLGLYACAWILLAAGYTYSGYWKMLSPSWIDGTAMHHVLTNPLARSGALNEWILGLPPVFLKGLTWFALAGELLALPMLFWKRTRLISWLWMVGMHFGVLVMIDFADLTVGMLMIHLFVFDPDWLKALPNRFPLYLRDLAVRKQPVRGKRALILDS